MSKRTRPNEEPSVTCGFYNGDDCEYDAGQMSAIFDGIIKDGIFASIGTCLVVKAGTGNTVNVGTGKAWFNHTWTLNDAILPIVCPDSNPVSDMHRIDAIVLHINTNDDVRDNCIICKTGVESANPVRPEMQKSDGIYEYALCYIYRAAASTEIKEEDITNMIGTEDTPFITGILQTVDLNILLGQWQDDLNRFVAEEKTRATTEIDNYIDTNETAFDKWFNQMKTLMAEAVNEVDTWTVNQKATMLDWFEHMRDQLSEDAAVNLQMQIDKSEIERVLMFGFVDGQKTFSDDGTVITAVDSTGRTLVKTFTPDFLLCTTILTDSHNTELGRLVKTFSSDGKTVSSEITIN